MAIKFLSVSAEEAISTLSQVIEEGYEIKIGMDREYQKTKEDKNGIDNSSIHELVARWEVLANIWYSKAINTLGTIYIGKRMAYEFQEAKLGIGFQSDADNPKWYTITRSMEAKLNKLNEFDNFIKREFRVEIEYTAGDKFEHHGTGNQTITKDK